MSDKQPTVHVVIAQVALKEEKRPGSKASLSPMEIVAEAQRRAELLKDVPRDQLVAHFAELGEEVRQEAIAKGTSIDGDWTGD
jgi:hypothetical protein